MRAAKLTLYTRSSCSLCDEARRVLEDAVEHLAPRVSELEIVDIALHPSLWERYRYDIPVVLLDGEVIFRHRVDPVALEKLLLRRD